MTMALARKARRSRAASIEAEMARDFAAVAGSFREAYPLTRYEREPVLYARERLGVVYLPHQECLAYAVAGQWDRITAEMADLAGLENPGRTRIAVTSGQKTGKTKLIIGLGLWRYECFDGARALLTAAIGDQIRAVLWRELFLTLADAVHRPPEKPSEEPARGLVSEDRRRELRGFTGRNIESVAGYSGRVYYKIDEASHIEQKKYEALDGNTASDVDLPILMTSQATRNEGPFFDAFHSKSAAWTRLHFDSEKIARWCELHGVRVKGIASLPWVKSKEEEYGRESAFFQLRVLGQFLMNESGRIITMHLIEAARARWGELENEGLLSIGFDPAGPGDAGDELGFAPVRGLRALEVYTRRGLTTEAGLAELYGLLEKHRRPGEIPRVILDAEGKLGAEYYGRLRAEAEHRRIHAAGKAFEVYGVRTSSKHVREPQKFNRVRDEVWWCLSLWLQTGGFPPGDHKLEQELYAPQWHALPDGRIRATSKDDLREYLGRSPDKADALGLGVWQPRQWRPAVESAERQVIPDDPRDEAFDQQAAGDVWWPSGDG